MAIENITAHNNFVSFTDRDSSGFTAVVAMTPAELAEILLAISDDRYDEVIAKCEQVKAKARVAARERQQRNAESFAALRTKIGNTPTCDFCGEAHGEEDCDEHDS